MSSGADLGYWMVIWITNRKQARPQRLLHQRTQHSASDGAASFFPVESALDPKSHVSDAPRPIPAEGAWSGDLADLPNWSAMPRRNRRKRRRAPYPIWLKYLVVSLVLAVVLSLAQIALHAYRADPRDSRVFAERELRLTALRPNETRRRLGERLAATRSSTTSARRAGFSS